MTSFFDACNLIQLMFICRWTFHQNDDESTNILSYGARIYTVNVLGYDRGPAKECIECSRGSQVSPDGSSCIKCPVGTYSAKGEECIPCEEGYFTDKV